MTSVVDRTVQRIRIDGVWRSYTADWYRGRITITACGVLPFDVRSIAEARTVLRRVFGA